MAVDAPGAVTGGDDGTVRPHHQIGVKLLLQTPVGVLAPDLPQAGLGAVVEVKERTAAVIVLAAPVVQ